MVSRPKIPQVRYPDPPPPVPDRTDAQTQALAEAQRRAYARGGRSSTMLTPGSDTGAGSSVMRFLSGTVRN